MGALKLDSSQKRQQENENGPHSPHQLIATRQRLHSSDEPLKITDLIDDCLEMIFEHLDQRSLFNVVVENGYLRPATGEVFKRKFGTERVRMEGGDGFKLFADGSLIEIGGSKTCLRAVWAHRLEFWKFRMMI